MLGHSLCQRHWCSYSLPWANTSRTCAIRDARPSDHAVIKVMNDGIQQAELDLVGYPMLTPDQLPPSSQS